MGYVTIYIKRNLYRRMEQGNMCVLLNFQLLETTCMKRLYNQLHFYLY